MEAHDRRATHTQLNNFINHYGLYSVLAELVGVME